MLYQREQRRLNIKQYQVADYQLEPMKPQIFLLFAACLNTK